MCDEYAEQENVASDMAEEITHVITTDVGVIQTERGKSESNRTHQSSSRIASLNVFCLN